LVVGYALGNLSSLITLKNEIKEQKINTLNKEILNKINEINAGNAELNIVKKQLEDE